MPSWRSLRKIAGSEAGAESVSQKYGSADPDPGSVPKCQGSATLPKTQLHHTPQYMPVIQAFLYNNRKQRVLLYTVQVIQPAIRWEYVVYMSLSFDGCRRCDCWICLWIYVYYIILIPHPALCTVDLASGLFPAHTFIQKLYFRTIYGGYIGTEKEPSCRTSPPAYVAWRVGMTTLFLLCS